MAGFDINIRMGDKGCLNRKLRKGIKKNILKFEKNVKSSKYSKQSRNKNKNTAEQ